MRHNPMKANRWTSLAAIGCLLFAVALPSFAQRGGGRGGGMSRGGGGMSRGGGYSRPSGGSSVRSSRSSYSRSSSGSRSSGSYSRPSSSGSRSSGSTSRPSTATGSGSRPSGSYSRPSTAAGSGSRTSGQAAQRQSGQASQRPSGEGGQRTAGEGARRETGQSGQRQAGEGGQRGQGDVNREDVKTNLENRDINIDDRDINIDDGDIDSIRGEDGAAFVGEEHGVVVTEDGAAAWDRGEWDNSWEGESVWVGDWEEDHVFEDWEAWEVMAGVGTAIVVGTMIATLPPYYSTVYVAGSPYYYADGYYYEPIYQGTEVIYQVAPPPAGAVITTLPPGCIVEIYSGVSYQRCAEVWYTQAPGGWQVVVAPY